MSKLTTTFLEMNSPAELLEKTDAKGLIIVEAEIKEFRFNRYLYTLVGEIWSWTNKLALSEEQWRDYTESKSLRTWVAYYKGSIAGYFELNTDDQFNVEIAYFGLAPKFIGRGFGGYMLSSAIKFAWEKCNAKRVWVHTCNFDHPNALGNYQARGLKIYRVDKDD